MLYISFQLLRARLLLRFLLRLGAAAADIAPRVALGVLVGQLVHLAAGLDAARGYAVVRESQAGPLRPPRLGRGPVAS